LTEVLWLNINHPIGLGSALDNISQQNMQVIREPWHHWHALVHGLHACRNW